MASTPQCAFQETARQTQQQEQLHRLDHFLKKTLLPLHVLPRDSQHHCRRARTCRLSICPSIINQHAPRGHLHWHEGPYSLISLALTTHVQDSLYGKIHHVHSLLSASLRASGCSSMGSSGSHEDLSLMCDENEQTWRGRGKQAVRNQSTGELVVEDS